MLIMFSLTKKCCLLLVGLLSFFCVGAENAPLKPEFEQKSESLKLVRAVMCERIEGYSPVNRAVIFSVTVGKISCFTSFEAVSVETQIEHRWYFKETLTTKKNLFLKTPRWSTYSSIQLREADKGLWRVEIVDKKKHILGVLRFSVTD
jgi:hypothetical protein